MMEFRYCGQCEKIFGGGARCPSCGSQLELKEPSYFIGKSFGKYSVEGILGHGGMGIVYLARHSVLGRLAALKIILPELGDEGDTFLARFLREAQLLAGLKHHSIIDIYDFDVCSYGLPYYAMEYAEGISLRDLLIRYGKFFELQDYADIFIQTASALDYAHEKGIVHRDLKPDNILITLADGRPAAKILDFGIAKIVSEGEAGKTLTGEGNIIGTLNYIAPEQVLGGKISAKTDQYAFALIVAEILSGRPIREGKTLGEICATDIQTSIREESLPETAPEMIKAAIKKATSKDPLDRFEKVSGFVAALDLQKPEKNDKIASIIQRETAGCSPTITPIPSKEVISKLSQKDLDKTHTPTRKAEPAVKKKGVIKYIIGAAAVMAVIALLAFVFFKRPGKAGEPPKELPMCEKAGEWPVPPDSAKLLSSQNGTDLLLRGARSLYLMSMSSNQMPAMIPVGEGEKIAAVSESGDPVIFKDDKFVQRSLGNSEEQLLFALDKIKPEKLLASRTMRTLAVRTGRRITLYSIFLNKPSPIAVIEADGDCQENNVWSISDSYFARLCGTSLEVYSTAGGKLLFRNDFKEKVYDMYIDDASGTLVVWGWFDRLAIFSLPGGSYREIKVSGETKDALIIPDRPTLVSAGIYGIKFWDLATSELLYESAGGAVYSSILYSPLGILALDSNKAVINRFPFRTAAPSKVVKVCDNEIWSMAENPRTKQIFAGSSNGKIYILGEDKTVSVKELHTLGVTSIVATGDNVISSSDDKTIAVFKMPSMELQYRSTAHSYLINALSLAGSPMKLWSSSSDGSLKSWSLPNLQEQFGISLTELLGKKQSLHGFWVSEKEDRMLIGTWNHSLVYLRKDGPGFKKTVFDIPSRACIDVNELPGLELLLIAGDYDKSAIYVFDLKTGELYLLPQISMSPMIFSIATVPGQNSFFLCSFGEVLEVNLERGPGGRLDYSASLSMMPDMGCSAISILQSGGNSLVSASETGEIVYMDRRKLNHSCWIKGGIIEKISPRS